MFGSWSIMPKLKPAPGEVIEIASAPTAPQTGAVQLASGPLDAFGQKSEDLRERVSNLGERLADLQVLSTDFAQIIEPLNTFMGHHTAANAKLLELEALLDRERELSKTARLELNELRVSAAKTASENSELMSAFREQSHAIRDLEGQTSGFRIKIGELTAAHESLDGQLTAEVERARTISDENQMLRRAIEVAENARAKADEQLLEAQDTIRLSHAESARLQQMTEMLTQKVASLRSNFVEIEPQLHLARSDIVALQAKLATEQAARQKSEATREAERSALELEIASQTMRVQGLNAHIINTDKLLAHAREQLRDKADTLRATEKALTDLQAEKAIVDRQLETQQEALTRSTLIVQEIQRTNGELKDRCDMMLKAVAAKDSQIESGNRKLASLRDRIDDMNNRFQQERTEAEATHRRLIEELQNERAERSLAQGALDIARNSRTKILAQYSALKRQTSAFGSKGETGVDPDPELPAASSDNVTAFRPQE